MDYKKLIYWLTVADNAKTLFITFMIIFTAISVIATLCFIFGREDFDEELKCPKDGTAERAKKWMWWGYPFMIFFWSLFIFTPSKKDALLIVAGGETLNYLTTDSITKQIPHEMSHFVLTELKNMAAEAKVDLNIKNEKQKIIDQAKQMSSEELLNKLDSDSTFRQILLKKE